MRSIAIPATFLVGAIVSRWVLAFAPARWHIDIAQPLAVATNWGAYGALLWIVLAATLIVALMFYLRALRSNAPSLATTLWACALSLLAALAWAPLFSSDVYAYAAYGEMARLGMNPYQHLGGSSLNPILAAAQWQWSGAFPICVYGSAFVTLSQIVITITHQLGTLAALMSLRVLSCLSLLACAWLIGTWSTRAAWFLAMNPVAIWIAAEGHNDTVALAAVLAGFAVARKRAALGSAIVACAALIKMPALAASAALVIDAAIARARVVPVLIGSIGGVAIAVVGSLALIAGVRNNLAPHGHYLALTSVQALGVPVAIAACLLVVSRIPTFAESIDRWCVLACALWIAVPNPYPWYGLWLLAPAALTVDPRIRTTALAIVGTSLLRYIPDAVGIPTGIAGVILGLCALAAFAPLVL
jgi:hypothetical protein